MEFWLSFDNGKEKLRLPIPPSAFSIKKGTKVNVVNVIDVGEVGLIGMGLLATVDISSFFPNQYYPFCQYSSFPKPYECVGMLERWRNSKKPIRLMITDTDVNMAGIIESFEYGERDGTRDVYFSISIREYRFMSVTETVGEKDVGSEINRPINKDKPILYVVKSGDSLWGIAKELYGDGGRWKEIADRNKIKDPQFIPVGTELVI